MKEVSLPMVNQDLDNQNISYESEDFTSNNNNGGSNVQNKFTNQQRRNVNAHTTNFGSQNLSPSQKMQLGGFLGKMGQSIWSNAHGTKLTRLLQLTIDNVNGIVAALGHNT